MGIVTDLCDFFFPRICPGCGKLLAPAEEAFCVGCELTLPYTRLLYTPGNEMEKCFWGRFPVDRASSIFYYVKGGSVAHLLHAMKYGGQRKLCLDMGRLIADTLAGTGFFDGIDYLIPVPLYKKRLRERGYNQSELLAKGMAARTRIPLLGGAVYRTRGNDTQTHKSGYARWMNVDGLFCASAEAGALAGKHVLLVDDVLTTGATLIACADALSGISGVCISIVTLAWSKQ